MIMENKILELLEQKGSVSMNDDIFPLVEKEFEGQVIGAELYELAHQYLSLIHIQMCIRDRVISKEEFGEGVKRLAQADNPKPENPIDGAMNPPEKGRRTRRSAAQAQPDNADTAADETPAVDEQPTGRTRRVRKTR